MSAVLSPCGLYRFRLERTVGFDGAVYAFFGINPSTADATENDATVRKWIGFTKTWGGSRFIVGNVHPLRTKDVRTLAAWPNYLSVQRENTSHLIAMISEADILVPCWGNRCKVPRVMHNDIDDVKAMLLASGKPVMHLGLTKSGDPTHPQMLGYDTPLTLWSKQ